MLIGATLIIAGGVMATTKQYPVAVVDWNWVSAKDFEIVRGASEQFYTSAFVTYGKVAPSGAEKEKLHIEITRATLDRLIEELLVRNEAEQEVESLQSKIAEKIKSVDSQKLQNPVREMYGLGIDEFRRRVLEPQALQELLAATLAATGDSLTARIIALKKAARVILLFPGLLWTENGVELKSK